jgi:hypothetical protein
MSVINSQPLIGASGNQGVAAYNIERSLRFRSSASAYLSRTPASAGNRKTWTYSAWVKRGTLSSRQCLLQIETGSNNNTVFAIELRSDDKFALTAYDLLWRESTQVLRDPSAWYHLVVAIDTTQATAANRIKMYINGSQITSFTTSNDPSQNADLGINQASAHAFGRNNNNSLYFDGYFSETNFIDGQQLTPSSFGETDTITGVWKPKRYTGTYGTNGFYLPFTDVATTSGSNAGLGKDFSGNGNYWTTNNISVTAGATYDSMTDVPTLTSATQANYAVLNPLINSNGVLSNGNLTYAGTAAGNKPVTLSGAFKQYGELTIASGSASAFGLATATADMTQNTGLTVNNLYGIYDNGTGFYLYANAGSTVNIAGQTSAGVVFQLAYDSAGGKLWIGKNNVWYDSSLGTTGNPSAGTNPTLTGIPSNMFMFVGTGSFSTTYNVNFGQRPFTYTPPTNYLALNTYNLPDSTIVAGNKYMDAVTRSGFGSSGGSITSLNFSPDFIWEKARNNAFNHQLVDSVRGLTKYLNSNLTDAETTTSNYFTALNSNGYTLGSNDYGTGVTLVDWAWRGSDSSAVTNTAGSITSTVSANTSAGFSIVTYTGNGTSGATLGHGLGVAPKMIFVKQRNSAVDWRTYHASAGNTGGVILNKDIAYVTDSSYWNNTTPGSSVFTVGDNAYVNGNGNTYVAYCWSEIAGFSKFGSYTGNGSADGPFIYTGFRPKFIIRKSSTLAYGWYMDDTSRNPSNVIKDFITANSSAAETLNDANYAVDILSNGFKVRSSHITQNNNGDTYVYMAFAENPFRNSLAR